MSDNVVSFSGCAIIADGDPVPEIVVALERALESAKSGQTRALVMAAVTKTSSVDTYAHWIAGYQWQALGAAAFLQSEVNTYVSTKDEEPGCADQGA